MRTATREIHRDVDRPLVEPRRFVAAMFLTPVVAIILVAVFFFMPDHVPSRALAKAPTGATAPTPESIADKIRRCRLGLDVTAERLRNRPLDIWSLENDEGLIAHTVVRCEADRCQVQSTALVGTGRIRLFSCAGRRNIAFQ